MLRTASCFIVVAGLLTSCADPAVGRWTIDSWIIESALTDCDRLVTETIHQTVDAGVLALRADGTAELALDQVLDRDLAFGDASPFRRVDVTQVEAGSWERDDDEVGFCMESFCAVLEIDFAGIGDAAVIDTAASASLYEPCGSSSQAYRMQLSRE